MFPSVIGHVAYMRVSDTVKEVMAMVDDPSAIPAVLALLAFLVAVLVAAAMTTGDGP